MRLIHCHFLLSKFEEAFFILVLFLSKESEGDSLIIILLLSKLDEGLLLILIFFSLKLYKRTSSITLLSALDKRRLLLFELLSLISKWIEVSSFI